MLTVGIGWTGGGGGSEAAGGNGCDGPCGVRARPRAAGGARRATPARVRRGPRHPVRRNTLASSSWLGQSGCVAERGACDGCRAAGRGYLVRQQQRSARLRSAAAVEIQRGARVWLDNRYKLVFSGKTNDAPELYDLQTDPAEETNIAKKKQDLTTRLAGELREWQSSVLNSLREKDYPKN